MVGADVSWYVQCYETAIMSHNKVSSHKSQIYKHLSITQPSKTNCSKQCPVRRAIIKFIGPLVKTLPFPAIQKRQNKQNTRCSCYSPRRNTLWKFPIGLQNENEFLGTGYFEIGRKMMDVPRFVELLPKPLPCS